MALESYSLICIEKERTHKEIQTLTANTTICIKDSGILKTHSSNTAGEEYNWLCTTAPTADDTESFKMWLFFLQINEAIGSANLSRPTLPSSEYEDSIKLQIMFRKTLKTATERGALKKSLDFTCQVCV
jgi:hypothetical protein